MKILVVHPDEKIANDIAAQLNRNEIVIQIISSGLEGLFASRFEKFDLIICGTDMPIVSGYEIIRSVRTHSVNRNVPVVMLADKVNSKVEILSQALGVVAYFENHNAGKEILPMVNDLDRWLMENQNLN